MKQSKPAFIWIIAAFFAVYFIWGTTYLANVYVLQGMNPFVGSAIRYLVAGVILFVYVLTTKKFVFEKSNLKVAAISGTLMLVGGSGMVVYAEQYVTSGHAAVLIATEPIWFIIFDRKNWKFYFSRLSIIAGIVTGFVGIVLFMNSTPAGAGPLVLHEDKLKGSIIILFSAVLWVLGTLYGNAKLDRSVSNLQTTSFQLLAAGLVCALIAVPLHGWNDLQISKVDTNAWLGLAYLIVFGSLAAYLSFTWLVTVRPPALVSTHTYVNPVVALFAGWLIAYEKINIQQVGCMVLILTGVFLAGRNHVQQEPAELETT